MNLAIEMFDGSHYIVTAQSREGHNHPSGDIVRELGTHPVGLANVIIDLDTRFFIKNRTAGAGTLATHYEMEWFQRGTCTHMTAGEFQGHVQLLYRNR